MSEQAIEKQREAIANFYVERPVSEARKILDEAFRRIKPRSYVHDYVSLLREYADS